MGKLILLVCSILLFGVVYITQCGLAETKTKSAMVQMKLTSTAFENGDVIPVKYTCDGEDISPFCFYHLCFG